MLTSDPYLLLSIVNTKLRDDYSSLEEMAEDMNMSVNYFTDKLATINYFYDNQANQFKIQLGNN